MSKHPNVKWAQRKDRVFVEVQLRDSKDQKVELKETSLAVEGNSDGTHYAFNVQLFAQVVPEQSKWNKTGLGISILLHKKDASAEYWTRFSKATGKNQYITCDWTRWIDQQDEAQEGSKGLQGYDPSAYQNFNDSDDEDDEKGNLDDLDQDQDIESPQTKQEQPKQ